MEDYRVTFVDSGSSVGSLLRQIRVALSAPKHNLDSCYYQGEMRLPITEMPAWYQDLPKQIKTLFEKPAHPIEIFNRRQVKKRALCGLLVAFGGGVAGWLVRGPSGLLLLAAAGYVLGQVLGALLFRDREYPPEIWGDYTLQPASWVNSLLVHAFGIGVLILPFLIGRMTEPVKAAPTFKIADVSSYIPQLPASDKKMGGGGGGGDRSIMPPSQGRVPKFEKLQLAPPSVVAPVLTPKIPVQPSLLGPPDLKLPQMTAMANLGDPHGVAGPSSNGPGSRGGIGTGSGGGVGEGNGAGLGPGDTAGFGDGAYSVGGGISEPIAIYKPEPPYSEEARKAKYQGTVVLWLVIDADGSVRPDVRVVKPLGLGLDENAIKTVRTWKFKPALRNGIPVPVHMNAEINFSIF